MAILKFIFYLIFFILIKIGDFVYAGFVAVFRFFSSPFVFFKKRFQKMRLITPRYQKQGKRKTNSRKTIRLNHWQFFYFFSNKVKILKVFSILGSSITTVLTFLLKVITFPLRFFKRKKKGHRKEAVIKNKPRFIFKVKYMFVGALFAFIFFFLPATFFIFISDLPKLSNLSVNYISKSTKILDRNGALLFEVYANQNRTIVALKQVPMALREATVAIEVKDFYRHGGFDVRGIARALYVDITKKDFQGGSTITQQLIKSALLTPEPTISRKVREIVLALWAEHSYTKDQILELYFNYVPYGGTAWGVEAASQIYFGKDVSDLTLAESAYLAGLPQAPSQYSPFAGDGTLGKRRQKDVLNAMVEQKFITRKEAIDAYNEKLVFQSPQIPIQAPHFVMYVKDLLIRKYGLLAVERGGLQVTTSLDLDIQRKAEAIVADEVDRDGYLGIGNGASLVTNPQNGDILAMVGSRDYFDPEHDGNVNITTSLRQPGSTIKLVTYSLALSKGMTEATILDDLPLTISNPGSPSYTPVNYDGKFHGKVPLRIAFANSFNIPAVRLVQKYGVDTVVSFGKQMGITSWGSPDKYGVSITLGAAEVSMLDLATVYGTVANDGERVSLNPILKIVDSEGKTIEQKEVKPTAVLNPAVAYIISDILSDDRARSIEFGANSPLKIKDRKVSVKTGTTDNKRDNWTIGYTPDRLVATWVGNNDNTPLSQALASGITGAAPMWNRIMTDLLAQEPPVERQVPGNIVSKQCFGYTAYFVMGTEDKEKCRIAAPTPVTQQQ